MEKGLCLYRYVEFSKNVDHLVDVVLPCVHLKEPVIGFRSISLVKPAKLVIRNVGAEKLILDITQTT